jgi:hypothetical protein
VIREDDLGAAQPPRPPARERGQGLGEWPSPGAGPAPGQATSGQPGDESGYPRVRAITAGQASLPWPPGADGARKAATARSASTRPRTVPPASTAGATADTGPIELAGTTAEAASASAASTAEADPALAYGPDDPAYGPPGLDWYKRDGEQSPRPGEDEAESRSARGPFEPLRTGEHPVIPYADPQPADDEPASGDDHGDQPELPGYQSVADEILELLDLGTPSDPEAGALGQLTDLYGAAETISPAGLDTHFEELLEKQRKLISEYFMESGGLSPADAADPVVPADPVTPAEPPASATPLGFDTAASLAALRGELRNAD